jgi:hypothetical protein
MPSRVVGIAVAAFKRYREQQMTDRAAALTYFAMMSLFPALLVGVSLLGLFGQQGLVQDASNYLLEHGADETTADVVRKTLQNMINASSGALGATLLISLALALNGASGAFGAAGSCGASSPTSPPRSRSSSSSPSSSWRPSWAARSRTTSSARSGSARPRRRSGRTRGGPRR